MMLSGAAAKKTWNAGMTRADQAGRQVEDQGEDDHRRRQLDPQHEAVAQGADGQCR